MSEYKKVENAKAEMTVTLEGDSWKNAIDSAFNKLARKVEVKGFRKGQAPKHLVENISVTMKHCSMQLNHWLRKLWKMELLNMMSH